MHQGRHTLTDHASVAVEEAIEYLGDFRAKGRQLERLD